MTFTLTSPIPGTNVPIFGALSVLGGFLLQFTMGSFYSFGNMMTYMTSYMRMNGSPNITYEGWYSSLGRSPTFLTSDDLMKSSEQKGGFIK